MKEQEAGGGSAQFKDRTVHRKVQIRKTMPPQLTILSLLSAFLLVAASVTALGPATPNEQGTTSGLVELVSASVSKVITSVQVSACDGEQLSIRCDVDYNIDLVAAVYTILSDASMKQQPVEQKQDNRVNNLSIEPTSGGDEAGSSLVRASRSSHLGPQTCAPVNNSTSLLPLIAGSNATTTNYTVCDEQQAQRETDANSETAFALVRNACHLHNSCSIDVSRLHLMSTNSSTNSSATAATAKVSNTTISTRPMNEACPTNRQLLEVIYKCRPMRFNRKVACRGSQMKLECLQRNKKLLVASAHYGSFAGDTKNQEKCQDSQLQTGKRMDPSRPLTLTNASSPANSSLTLASTAHRNCQIRVLDLVNRLCLGKQLCHMDVNPSIFGQTQCAPGQSEYLMVIYSCVNENVQFIPQTSTGAPSSQNVTFLRSADTSISNDPKPGSVWPNVSLSPIMSHPTTSLVDPQQQQQKQQFSVLATTMNQADTGTNNVDTNLMLDQMSDPAHTYTRSMDLESNPVFAVINADPDLSRLNPRFWTEGQKVRFLFARYQPQLMAFACLIVSALILAFAIRSCRSGSRSSRNSSGSSSTGGGQNSASCSSKSFNSTSNSIGTATTVAAGGPLVSGPAAATAHLKHNSCSESCFSLDDYHGSSNNHSPALDSVDGRFIQQQQQQQQQVRPKLWSIYGNHEQVAHQQRSTMRPNRTFLGPPHQQLLQVQQQPMHSHTHNELLLALAVNQQQQAAANNWCATLQQPPQFQPKHFSVIPPPPPNLQLELSHATDLVIPIHPQQQQQQHQQQRQVNQFEQPYFGLAPPAQEPQT